MREKFEMKIEQEMLHRSKEKLRNVNSYEKLFNAPPGIKPESRSEPVEEEAEQADELV